MLRYGPKRLVLVDNHNTALFYIEKELVEAGYGALLTPIVGDVKDEVMLDNLFKTYGPQVVFHAAAHKHVPLMETNPQEAVKNNTLGTYALADAATKYKAERFLYISTDKAVRPSSVMGASKRLGEMVIRAFADVNGTKCTGAVRQRAGQLRQRGAHLPGADTGRRAHNGYAPGRYALFYDGG